MIKIGDLCRVVVNNHIHRHLGDLVLITKIMGKSYIEGINARTGNRHHYPKESLEKL